MTLFSWIFLLAVLSSPLLALLVCGLRVSTLLARRRRRIDGPPRLVERRRVWVPAALYLVLVAVSLLYAVLVEPFWIEVTRTEIPVPRAALGRDRLRIVHLSDLHLDGLGRRETSVLEAVRRERPDLIVLTGDYLNSTDARGDLVRFLRSLQAPGGVYGVTGNWDYRYPVPEAFAEAGVTLLQDQQADVGADLSLVGLKHRSRLALADLPRRSAFRILLHHSPDAIGMIERDRADLFLCGHTHGGQVSLPLYGSLVSTSASCRRYQRGLFRVGSTSVYVNRGIGMTGVGPGLRFFSRPEVAVIDLVAR